MLIVVIKIIKRLNEGEQMRKLSKLLLTLVFALSISSTSYAVTVASWGGAYTESQKLGYGDPSAKKLGIPINWVDYSGGLSEVKAQKAAGKITWDIMDVFAMDTINGCDEGLFVKFDFDKDFPPAPDGTKASKDFFTSMPSKCAVGNILYSWTYAYHDATVTAYEVEEIESAKTKVSNSLLNFLICSLRLNVCYSLITTSNKN